MTVIDTELPYSLVDLCLSVVVTIMSAILMCLSAGYFAATLPPVVLAVWGKLKIRSRLRFSQCTDRCDAVLQKYYLRTSRQLRLLDLEAKSPLYSHFIESLSGLVTIRAFGWADKFCELNLKLLDISQKPYYLLFCIQRWLGLLLDLIVATLAVILMILVVKLRTEVSGGFVGLALLNVVSSPNIESSR
jgi:ATP-binding cassette subfamily C (CFTR/MRP) protein 1